MAPPQAVADASLAITITIFHYNGIDEVPPTITHLTVDSSVKVIPPAAFLHCDCLTQVELPEGIEKIDRRAFSYCHALKSIIIPSTVREIAKRAFYKCHELKDIILPQGLSKLDEESFDGCRSLEKIHIPPLVETIEVRSFSGCTSLTEVILPVNLQEIKESAFQSCESLHSIHLPSSLKVVGKLAFVGAGLTELHLPDSVEDCGSFKDCKFANLRIPPLISDFDSGIFELCAESNIISIELPENIKHVIYPDCVHARLPGMRSIAYPVGCHVHIAHDIEDTTKSFLRDTVQALQHRFDHLPIHKLCYYHSYHDTEQVLADMSQVISPRPTKKSRRSAMFSLGKRQDLYGMTPLHILACSTTHHLELYEWLIEKYPENLTVRDMWGDIPLLYALRCNAPPEVIEFFAESFWRYHPDYVFDWGDMIEQLIANVPLPRLQVLIDMHDQFFPDQEFNLLRLVIRVARGMKNNVKALLEETFKFLLHASIVKRLDSLNVKQFSTMFEEQIKVITLLPGDLEPKVWELYSELANVERVKETTTQLELMLWGMALADQKTHINNLNSRDQYRVNCGAEIAIRNVIPFLWVPRYRI